MDLDKEVDKFIEEEAVAKNWRLNPKWLSIKGITRDNVINFTGPIERGTRLKGDNSKQSNKKIFTFGKYRGKTHDWVKENDPSYWDWAEENIKGFKKK